MRGVIRDARALKRGREAEFLRSNPGHNYGKFHSLTPASEPLKIVPS
jgi:hypothetical protein